MMIAGYVHTQPHCETITDNIHTHCDCLLKVTLDLILSCIFVFCRESNQPSKMLSLQKVLLLVSLALLEISLVSCDSEDLGVYGNQEDFKEPDDEQMQNMLESMYRNYPLNQYEESYGK